MSEPENRDQWPGVDRAYDFVLPSYQLLVSRFEAADNRIQSLQAFASTLILGTPLLAKSVSAIVSLRSTWFLLAVATFLLIVLMGLAGRSRGTLKLPHPAVLYQESLHLTEWEFKRDAVFFAGEHFGWNAEAIRVKGNCAALMMVLFIVMVGLLLAWVGTIV